MGQVTKQQAAAALIDGAMRSHEAGDEVCAIALAGAAEEAMPRVEDKLLFDHMRDTALPWFDNDKQKAVRYLNRERDWLKHNNADQPEIIDTDNAIMYIIRAYGRYKSNYGIEADTPTMKDYWSAARSFDPDDG